MVHIGYPHQTAEVKKSMEEEWEEDDVGEEGGEDEEWEEEEW